MLLVSLIGALGVAPREVQEGAEIEVNCDVGGSKWFLKG